MQSELEKLIELMNDREPFSIDKLYFALLNPLSPYTKELLNKIRQYLDLEAVRHLDQDRYFIFLQTLQKQQEELALEASVAKAAAKAKLEQMQDEKIKYTPLPSALPEFGHVKLLLELGIEIVKTIEALRHAANDDEINNLWQGLQQKQAQHFVLNAMQEKIQFFNANGQVIPLTENFLNKAAQAYVNPNAPQAMRLVMKSFKLNEDDEEANNELREKLSVVSALNSAFKLAKVCASQDEVDAFDYKAVLAANNANRKNQLQQQFLRNQQTTMRNASKELFDTLYKQTFCPDEPERTYTSPFAIPKPGQTPRLGRK